MLKMLQSNIINVGRWAFNTKEALLDKLAQNNYHTAKALYQARLRRSDTKYHSRPPLIVHQMGKVGSSSVTDSLKQAKTKRHIYHTHFLSSERVAEYEQKRKSFFGTEKEGELKHIWQYEHLKKLRARGLNGEKWKVVTLVRDPVARNLSAFFEHIEFVSSPSAQRKQIRSIEYDFEVTIKDNDLTEVIEIFFERFRHDGPLNFMDTEINEIFNVNVYAMPFPTAQGYQICHGPDADILIIRLEDLNNCAAAAFKEFLNIQDFKLVTANVSSDKVYADLYQDFKDVIILPTRYLDRVYNSKFAQHFYSQAEIANFRAKWTSGVHEPA